MPGCTGPCTGLGAVGLRSIYETATQQALLRKREAAEKVFGSAADQVKRKGKGSARRGPDVRKRTSVEDAYTLIESGECVFICILEQCV